MTLNISEDDARRRIEALADEGQTVHSITRTGSTDARAFYSVVRTWEHPEETGLSILCVQNAQLAADWADLTDTYLSGSYRQRFETGNGDTARAVAKGLAAAAARIDKGADDRPAEYNEADQ